MVESTTPGHSNHLQNEVELQSQLIKLIISYYFFMNILWHHKIKNKHMWFRKVQHVLLFDFPTWVHVALIMQDNSRQNSPINLSANMTSCLQLVARL